MIQTQGLAAWVADLTSNPTESTVFDERWADQPPYLEDEVRSNVWGTVSRVLKRGPITTGDSGVSTALILGRIQSGKTTAITAMTALSRDVGYRIVIALLGSTNLLLEQNTGRILGGLGIGSGLRSTYGWKHVPKPSIAAGSLRRIRDAIDGDRTLLLTILKHPTHINRAIHLIERLAVSDLPAVIIDDEADQASLNTMVSEGGDSATHSALSRLSETLEAGLYCQFTATPYAPLLIEPDDPLSPQHVEILEPGPGYTGAKEFFIDSASLVLREVPRSESSSKEPTSMPSKLREALASFLVGAAWLHASDPANAPISMLIHSSHRTNVHERLDALVTRELREWDEQIQKVGSLEELPPVLLTQLDDLAQSVDEAAPGGLLMSLQTVSSKRSLWVVNSQAEAERVDWSASPSHVLIGGNKLDRGFTIEGLTVTYLSRPRSPQLDTLYQRARAFGYRSEYLPFCRFYGSAATLETFQRGIQTDLLMRDSLKSWIEDGNDVRAWSTSEPLLMEQGIRPTRPAIIMGADVRDLAGWNFVTNPSLDPAIDDQNHGLLDLLGVENADPKSFGRLSHRFVKAVPIATVAHVVRSWTCGGRCSWRGKELAAFLEQVVVRGLATTMPAMLLESPEAKARQRDWNSDFGIVSLMQGRDKSFETLTTTPKDYPGDRYLLGGATQLQIHRVALKGSHSEPLLVAALRIGSDVGPTTEFRRAKGD